MVILTNPLNLNTCNESATKWNSTNISSYTITLQPHCYCLVTFALKETSCITDTRFKWADVLESWLVHSTLHHELNFIEHKFTEISVWFILRVRVNMRMCVHIIILNTCGKSYALWSHDNDLHTLQRVHHHRCIDLSLSLSAFPFSLGMQQTILRFCKLQVRHSWSHTCGVVVFLYSEMTLAAMT